MTDVDITLVTDEADRQAAYAVRHRVFVDEQGVPLDLERDGLDDQTEHLLGRLDGRPVAAARLMTGTLPTVGVAQRVAVLAELRGTGVGAALMGALEARARERGMTVIELHAQVPVRGFYERLGYAAYGEEYDEAGIPHVSMRKRL